MGTTIERRVTIERQPTERGTRGVSAAPAGQCCCCCCCCLHSLGGALGALTAFEKPSPPPAIPMSATQPMNFEPKTNAAGLYWAMVSLISGLAAIYFFGVERAHVETGEVLLMLAVFFPAIQLAASVVAAIVILRSKRVGRPARFAHLMKITARAFLGALIGAAIMIPIFR